MLTLSGTLDFTRFGEFDIEKCIQAFSSTSRYDSEVKIHIGPFD